MTSTSNDSNRDIVSLVSKRLYRKLVSAQLGPLRGGGLWASVGVITVYLAISVAQYGQPYVIDEAVFPYVADGILKNGAPFFYNGEFRPENYGLWHPPLYDYLLAGHTALWGVSTYAVRSFGAICVILSFFLLALALRRIAPTLGQPAYVLMASLFLLNPLVISGALIPDIDGSLGVLLVAGGIWVSTLVTAKPLSGRVVLAVFILATVAISSKYIIAGVVALIVGSSSLIAPAQRWWKVLWVLIAFAAGTIVSLGSLAVVGLLVRFDSLDPFSYLFDSLGSRAPGRAGLEGAVANLLVGPGSNMVWIGPAIVMGAIVSCIALVKTRPRDVNVSLVGLTLVASLIIILGYSYISASPFGFPKYTPIAVPGLALVVTVGLSMLPALRVRGGKETDRSAAVLLTAFGLVLIIGIAAVFAIARRYEDSDARDVGFLTLVTAITAICVLVAAIVLIPSRSGGSSSAFRRTATIGLVAVVVFTPIVVQTSSSLVNLTSPFSTRYYYGERGLGEFLTRASTLIPQNATLIAPKDVGLQIDRRFYEDAYLLPLKPAKLRVKLEQIGAPYLISRNLWDYSEIVYPDQFRVIREFYEPVLSGPGFDFVLWKLK